MGSSGMTGFFIRSNNMFILIAKQIKMVNALENQCKKHYNLYTIQIGNYDQMCAICEHLSHYLLRSTLFHGSEEQNISFIASYNSLLFHR